MRFAYELYDKETGRAVDVYMGVSAHHKRFFDSVRDARKSNCHDMYADRVKYGVRRVDFYAHAENSDPALPVEIANAARDAAEHAALNKKMDELGIKGLSRINYAHEIAIQKHIMKMMEGLL